MNNDLPAALPDTKYATLEDPVFGPLDVMVPIPGATSWGVLEPLRGTPWESFVTVVSGTVYSRANLRDTKLLREALGRPPVVNLKRLPVVQRTCRELQLDRCPLANLKECQVPNKKLPLCFRAPEMDSDLSFVVTCLLGAMNQGRYAVIVEGDEFIL